MNLSEQLMADYIQAMKNKDALKKEILNYIVSQIKYKKIELQQDPSDADVIQIIKKEIKAREESMEYLTKSWNMDELNLEVSRIEIMKTYLPEMMPKDQLEILVKKFIAELWIADPKKERGVVIQAVMKDHKSVIDGKMLNEIINWL